MADLNIEKIATENPFVDEIIYYTKYLAYNAVIKDEDKANKYETMDSINKGRIYRACIENVTSYEMFYDLITEELLTPIERIDTSVFAIPVEVATSKDSNIRGDLLGGITKIPQYDTVTVEDPNNPGHILTDEDGLSVTKDVITGYVEEYVNIDYFINNPRELPYQIRKYLMGESPEFNDSVNILRERFLSTYEETNDYYRTLNGLPKYGEEGINIKNYYTAAGLDPNDRDDSRIISNIEGIPESERNNNPIYIHQLGSNQLSIAVGCGLLDVIKNDNPSERYLDHLTDKKIEIYDARLAYNFQILYLPEVELNDIRERFKDRFNVNRDVVIKTIYSDAMKYGSDYYNEFIIIYILIHTMIDILGSLQEIILRREFIDSRCIKYIFSMYNIPYYEEIPVKYQINLMKNINNLLKFKSTSKNMKDICALFGFENIDIYRHYILKRRKTTESDYYVDESVEDHDPLNEYYMDFIKVPLGDAADLYIKDSQNYTSYDDVVKMDDYWDGDIEHNKIKREHVLEDFSYRKSKYISIDTVNDIAKRSFEATYFNGILFDEFNLDAEHSTDGQESHIHKEREDDILISVPSISTNQKFQLAHLFVLMYDLSFAYYGIESTIQYDTNRILYVLGFNFYDVLNRYNAIAEDLHKKGYDIQKMLDSDNNDATEPLHIQDTFNIKPSAETEIIFTAENLIDLFNNNMELHNYISEQMFNAQDHEMYEAYESIYDAFMVSKYNRDYFSYIDANNEKQYYETLTDFLRSNSPELYNCAIEVRSMTDEESKIKRINALIYNITQSIDLVIKDDSLSDSIYSNLPAVSSEFVKQYMAKIIDFFKSFRVQLYNINSILEFGDSEFGKYMTNIRYHDEISSSVTYTRKYDHYDMNDTMMKTVNLTKSDKFKMMDKILISHHKG